MARASGWSARIGGGQVDADPRDPRAGGAAGRQRAGRGRAGAGRRGHAAEPPRADAGGVPGPLRQLQPAAPGGAAGHRAVPSAGGPAAGTGAGGGGCSGADGRRAGAFGCRKVHPRVFGRPAAAHRHRPRPDHPPQAHHPRRGGLGTRRAGPGADPRPSGGSSRRATGCPISSSPTTSPWCGPSPTG